MTRRAEVTAATNTTNATIVADLYGAFARGDETTIRRILHPDIEWIQCAGFPGGGHRHGVDEVLTEVVEGLRREWTDFRSEVEETLVAGGSVVTLGHYVGTSTTTGRSMRAAFAHVFDLTQERITRFRQYTDTQQLVVALE